MSAAAYIEDLSPLQIASLTRIARHRLLVRQDYSLRHVVGHTLLLDNLKMEAERKNKEKMAREASTDNLAPWSREAPHVQSSVIVTVSELADVDRSPLQVSGQYTEPRVSGPLYWSKRALAKLPMEGSLEEYEESCEAEISNQSKEQVLKFHRYLSHLVETFEKSDDECDSESSSESDESESESE